MIRSPFRLALSSSISQVIKVICPCLHHPATLGKMLSVVVSRADFVSRSVRELPFNRIWMPALLFVQEG